jgi:hypothetical protein
MPTTPSIGEELFKEMMAHPGHPDTVSFLKAMINSASPTTESEYRDFKGMTDKKGKTLNDGEIRSIWSEAVAGFATTGGGVLIWGLDARKFDNDTVDRVVGPNLVIDPDGLKSRLQQVLPQATDPPVVGVRIESFPDSTQNNAGFVVCFIPESPYKPHRTEMGGKRWVMRVADSFIDVPPPVLRSLFFPNRRSYITARVAAKIEDQEDGSTSGVMSVVFEIRLYNAGPATAKELLLIAQPVQDLAYREIPLWASLNTLAGHRFIYGQAFHPGQMIEAPPAQILLPVSHRMSRELGRGASVDLQFQIYAMDQEPQAFHVYCDDDGIRANREWELVPEAVNMARYS